MSNGPRFGPGAPQPILWKHACRKEEALLEHHARRNEVLAKFPKKDSLSIFMAEFESSARVDASHGKSSAPQVSSTYHHGPLDGYHRKTGKNAALEHGAVPVVSMRVLPLPPHGARPYEPMQEEHLKASKPFVTGYYLASSNEAYGWDPNKEASSALSLGWHGRRKWNTSEDAPKPKVEDGARVWHGRKKWSDGGDS